MTNPAARRFEPLLADLLEATGASRTTLRLDWPEWGAHVDDVVAEARRPGVASLVGKTSIRQREAETAKWLEHERRVLVQEDCSTASPAPPPALLELYGVRAQMLGPVVWRGDLVGWISVHENTATRQWAPTDVSALESATAAVRDELSRAGTSPDGTREELAPPRAP